MTDDDGTILSPYLLFLGDSRSSGFGKTAQGLAHWRPGQCLAQTALEGSSADVGLPRMSIGEAVEAGARTMVIGVANVGGFVDEVWVPWIVEAFDRGLDVASGLHARLSEIDEVRDAAERSGRRLHDVRHADRSFEPGTGEPRAGRRLLMVGTDCDVGKMYSALAIERELQRRGVDAEFRATGQTGILIAGRGVAIDAVVSDFVSGAAEWLSPAAADDHWDVIEGQGCIHHPAYAAVTYGLIHGSQADALVLCHAADRQALHGFRSYPTLPLARCIEENLAAARLTSSAVVCVGVSVNTSMLTDEARVPYLLECREQTGLPCVDPVATGVAPVVDQLEKTFDL